MSVAVLAVPKAEQLSRCSLFVLSWDSSFYTD